MRTVVLLACDRPLKECFTENGRGNSGARSPVKDHDEGHRLSITVAYLAECQGSATIDEQQALLAPDDHVVVAGRQSFNKLNDLLAQNSIRLRAGDRLKVYDLSCISLSTSTLVRAIVRMLRKGITFEIVSASLVIEPDGADRLHALLAVLDGHYRYLHGVKTHPVDRRGRRSLLDPDQLSDIRGMLDRPGATASSVARELGVARATLYNYLERHDPGRRSDLGRKAQAPLRGGGLPGAPASERDAE